MFIRNDGRVFQLVYDGERTYWRSIPPAAAELLPPASIIEDPNGHWRSLWKVGAK